MKLVHSADGRALVIRDHLLPLVRGRGALETQRGAVRLVSLWIGPWAFEHRTPFADLYRHALERQHTAPDLPYGLDVRHGRAKVLRVLWADHGAFAVAVFARGAWEDEALAL